MYYELTKAEKKIARTLIDKGLQKQYARAISDMADIIHEWEQKKPDDNRDTYMAMFKTLKKADKQIANRYDGVGGSRWASLIAEQVADGLITPDELKGMRAETQDYILVMSGLKPLTFQQEENQTIIL